jgi:hypothetical protein
MDLGQDLKRLYFLALVPEGPTKAKQQKARALAVYRPGSTLDYLSEKTKPDWVVPPIRFHQHHKYLKCQNAERKYPPDAQ